MEAMETSIQSDEILSISKRVVFMFTISHEVLETDGASTFECVIVRCYLFFKTVHQFE